jgi:hypothetical protein
MRSNWNRWIFAGCALWLVAGPGRAASLAATPAIQSRDFSSAAAKAPAGSRLRVEDVQVADGAAPVAFSLERFEVFASDARVTIHGDGGDEVLPAPANVYFRGVVEGRPESRVFLARLAGGGAQGIVSDAGETYLIGGDDAPAKALSAPLEMRRVEPALLKSGRGAFACAEDRLPQGAGNARPALDLGGIPAASEVSAPSLEKAVATRTARVAIETDFEFYQRFNNSATATTYIGNLIGYISTIYTSELSTSLVVQSVSLWTTSNDPWNQTSGTLCGLMEFGYYWNKNKTGVSRTIAHFLSGKSLGGGVAWLGVLCSGGFNTSATCPGLATDAAWGGGYGFTASIAGNFNVNNPTVVWDSMAVAHEIGHNFDSPHSHCYANIGGNANPIDQCYSGEGNGCYSGATSLPGPAGAGSGTIMSYCHLVRGSYSDISMTFGTTATYGVQPGREVALMNSYVNGVASSNPACLALVNTGGLLADGFESGALPGPWSGKTP